MVKVSDGKTRPSPMRLQLSMELLKLQKEEITPPNQNSRPSPTDSRVLMFVCLSLRQKSLILGTPNV
ncbi:hypothetical protein O3M35_009819 [Rhynocoris fuscipes]|uniref:Uncharacterized protein n=1 Tax=Rhynocoris fuscipes TaxID=488301 RepID=A0AAW1D533_9HEMI